MNKKKKITREEFKALLIFGDHTEQFSCYNMYKKYQKQLGLQWTMSYKDCKHCPGNTSLNTCITTKHLHYAKMTELIKKLENIV